MTDQWIQQGITPMDIVLDRVFQSCVYLKRGTIMIDSDRAMEILSQWIAEEYIAHITVAISRAAKRIQEAQLVPYAGNRLCNAREAEGIMREELGLAESLIDTDAWSKGRSATCGEWKPIGPEGIMREELGMAIDNLEQPHQYDKPRTPTITTFNPALIPGECLCKYAILNWDGVTHDPRCNLAKPKPCCTDPLCLGDCGLPDVEPRKVAEQTASGDEIAKQFPPELWQFCETFAWNAWQESGADDGTKDDIRWWMAAAITKYGESQVSELRKERDAERLYIADVRNILEAAVDRQKSDCESVSLPQLASIASNAIHWRDKQIKQAEERLQSEMGKREASYTLLHTTLDGLVSLESRCLAEYHHNDHSFKSFYLHRACELRVEIDKLIKGLDGNISPVAALLTKPGTEGKG